MKRAILSVALSCLILFASLCTFPLTANAEEDIYAITDAVSALLIGAEPPEEERTEWTDEQVLEFVYRKLLYDHSTNPESMLHELLGEPEWASNATAYPLEGIQKLTQDALGREFPTTSTHEHLKIVGDKVHISELTGSGFHIYLQGLRQEGDTVTVIGYSDSYLYEMVSYGKGFEAEFVKNPSSVYGYTLTAYRPVRTITPSVTASASSVLDDSSSYAAANVLDMNPATAWAEGVDGNGEGEWIELKTTDGSNMSICAISILSGYHKSNETLMKNGRPSELIIETDDGESFTKFAGEYGFIHFDTPVSSSSLRFTLNYVAEGDEFQDACISEITLHELPLDGYTLIDPSMRPTTTCAPKATTTVTTTANSTLQTTSTHTEATDSDTPHDEEESGFGIWLILIILLLLSGAGITVWLIVRNRHRSQS